MCVCMCVFSREHNEYVTIATSCSQNFNVFSFEVLEQKAVSGMSGLHVSSFSQIPDSFFNHPLQLYRQNIFLLVDPLVGTS